MTDPSFERFEIARAIHLLETNGYVVRRPIEADLPAVFEIIQEGGRVAIRTDLLLNGKTYCLKSSFDADLLLDPDLPEFRDRHVASIIFRELANYIADGLMRGAGDQLRDKIEQIVPQKRLSLGEVESYLSWALSEPRTRL